MDGLTPAEMKFFETGNVDDLGIEAAPAPAVPPAPVPTHTPAPPTAPAQPAPTPVPVRAEAPSDFTRLLEEESRRYAQLEARLAEVQKRLEPAPAPPPAAPDPEKDPLGHLLHKINAIESKLSGLHETTQQKEQMTAEQQRYAALQTAAKVSREEFTKTAPDFADAYAHLRAARADDLRDVGVPEHLIAEALLSDEINVTQNALAKRQNPAEVLYKMAKRYGYTPKAQATPEQSPEDKIRQIVEGQKAADAPPKGGMGGELTLGALKDASEADLEKLAADDKLWKKVMGGRDGDIFLR